MLAHRTRDDRSSAGNGRDGNNNSRGTSGGGLDDLLSRNSMDEYRIATHKVELPLFDGSDPVGWITRAETYFEIQNVFDNNKVKLTKLSMEGSTIHWFNLLFETEDHLSWAMLKQALIERTEVDVSLNWECGGIHLGVRILVISGGSPPGGAVLGLFYGRSSTRAATSSADI